MSTDTNAAPAFDATSVTGTVETRPLDSIRPYWRNPRTIPEQAVNAVMDSIQRYGYRNLILVDSDGVIVNGHTRYAALRKLGVEEVAVMVAHDLPAEKVREFRIMDNKTGEFSGWDFDALVLELREVEDIILDTYFPEVDLEVGTLDTIDQVTREDVEKAEEKVTDTGTAKVVDVTAITCPSCFHTFDVKTDTL